MSRSLLLMLAGSWNASGPWVLTQGSEQAIKVTGLGELEQVELETDNGDSIVRHQLKLGLNEIRFNGAIRYRAVKSSANGHGKSTIVEVIINGSSSAHAHADNPERGNVGSP